MNTLRFNVGRSVAVSNKILGIRARNADVLDDFSHDFKTVILDFYI